MLKKIMALVLLFPLSGALAGKSSQEVTLKPKMREISASEEVDFTKIRSFLDNILIVDKKYNTFGKVKSIYGGHLLADLGDKVIVKGKIASHTEYLFVKHVKTIRKGKKEILGEEYEILGEGRKLNADKFMLQVTSVKKPIEIKAMVIPKPSLNLPTIVQAKKNINKTGSVISIPNGIWDAGKKESVIITLGKKDNLKVGNKLNIYDLVGKRLIKKGELLVYKTCNNISAAIITNAVNPVSLGDLVK